MPKPRQLNHVAIVALVLVSASLAACTDPGVTQSPPPHPTVIVITASGPYIALFDEPQDWLVGESDASWGRLVDGEYVLSIKKPQQLAWTNQTRVFGDGIYEVDARLETGPEASGFGMLLIGSNDLSSFLYILITGDGRYDVGYCDTSCANETSLIGGYKLSAAIIVDNQFNHLRVELNEGTLSLTISGALVSQIQNLSYGRGVIGLIGESSQFGGFEAAFDNFSVVETHPSLPTLIATVTPVEAVITATPDPLSTVPALLEPTPNATP